MPPLSPPTPPCHEFCEELWDPLAGDKGVWLFTMGLSSLLAWRLIHHYLVGTPDSES